MDSITLKDFRCFREEQIARLAPLTLLVGENSTGKTSFMAMIRALWDIAYQHQVPDFKEDPYDLGSFDEIAHHRGGRGSRAEAFKAGFNAINRRKRRGSSDSQPYRLEVTFGRNGTVPVPVRRRLEHENLWIEENFGRNQTERLRIGTPRGSWTFSSKPREIPLDIPQYTIRPLFSSLRVFGSMEDKEVKTKFVPLEGSPEVTQKDLEQLERLERFTFYPRFFSRIHRDTIRPFASAPVRSKPRRTYDPARSSPDSEGEYVPMYLASLYFQDQRGWPKLKNALENFGQDAGLFHEISIKPLGKRDSEPFQVQVRKAGRKRKGPQRNIIDVGYGVSQVLPVITELLRQDAPPMFLLQQPEVHLHPSAQAALGSLFCRVASPERQLIVETHSDHLLDRVRMDVRDGASELKPEDVSILFFERNDLDVSIHSIRLDKLGNILDTPDNYRSFFMKETRRSLGL